MTLSGPVAEDRLRAAVAARPQHLLLTLLGDHWYPRFEDLPSVALVGMLGEFGVTESNARAALSRLARRGLLESARRGRRTAYALTREGMSVLEEGTRRIFTFATEPRAWDGRWTLVAFSVPEDSRGVRATLRTRLGWLGFAALFDAVWVAPGNREREVAALLDELGVTAAAVLVGVASTLVPGGTPVAAWDLEGLRAKYEEFVERFTSVHEELHREALSPAVALVARTALIDMWREFPALDPELPAELLPTRWPQASAHDLFTRIYDELGPLATERVREILEIHAPDQADLASFHTSSNALDLPGRAQL